MRGLADDLGVDGFSAQVRYDIPVEVPSGRAGMSPSLALTYSGDLGNGVLGVGWTLALPSVRRSTRLGVPSFTDQDELELIGLGSGGRLVQLPDGSYRAEKEPFGPKVERSGEGFQVTLAGGTRILLGTTAASRQSSGARVAVWHVEKAIHPTGEQVVYEYTAAGGQQYLSGVRWGPGDCYRLQLMYQPRPDRVVGFRTGMRVETHLRLGRVQVEAFGETLREYHLTYDDALPLSRLATVRMTGRGGEGALPTLTFQYAPLQPAQVQELTGLEGWALQQQGVSLLDVDGDGMSDLLRLDSLNGHAWRKNWGEHFAGEASLSGPASATLNTARLMDIDGDARPELILDDGFSWQSYRLTAAGWVHEAAWSGTDGVRLFDDNLFFADLNGDGRVDLLRNAGDELHVKWNTSAGLGDWEVHPSLGSTSVMLGANLRFQEVNGDGLADAIEVAPDFVQVFLGHGDGTFEPGAVQFFPWPEAVADLTDLRFGDLNRDGLMDLIRLQAGAVSWYPGIASGGFALAGRIFEQPNADFTEAVVSLADINGNGSEDVVWSTTDSTWRLDLAGPTSAGMLVGIDNGLGKTVSVAYDATAILSTAAEAAGKAWTQLLPVSIPVPTWLEVSPGAGTPARRTRYGLRDGLWDVEERRFAGFLSTTTSVSGATPAETLITETRFHPGHGADRVLRGMPLWAEKRTGAGTVITTDIYSWEARLPAGLPDSALLRIAARLEQRSLHQEGLTTPLETLSRWRYDDRVRPIEEALYGRLDLQGDESLVERSFASDETHWVHDALCEERVYAATQIAAGDDVSLQRAARPTSQQRFFFGDATTLHEWSDAADCKVGRGLPRREQAWLDAPEGERWVTVSESRYDAWDNVIAAFADGVWRSFAFDAEGHFPVSESVSPTGATTLTWKVDEWDRVLGVQRRVTDANGVTAFMEYDALGRPTGMGLSGQPAHVRYRYEWEGPRPKTWTYVFDGVETELADSWAGGWQQGGKWREAVSVSNGAGEPLYSATRLAEDRWIVTGWRTYDPRGQVVERGDAFYAPTLPSALPAGTPRQSMLFDALGRLTRQTLPTSAVRTVAYSAFGATSHTEGLEPVTTLLDGMGRIRRTERTIDGSVESVDAELSPEGRIQSLSLNGGAAVHRYRYDTVGRLVSAHDPDIGERTFEYNDFGWLLKHTNGAGQVRAFAYDLGGRLVETSGDGATYRYHYDAPKPGGEGTFLAGRLSWVEEPRGEVQVSYDALGRNTRVIRWVEGRWADETMAYSLSGLHVRGAVDGLVLTPSYDAAGRAVGLDNYWRATELDAGGRVLAERYGNGVVQTYTRDAQGMPQAIDVVRGTSSLYRVNVGRNAWGAPTWVEDTDGVGLDHTATFAYDGAGRLVDMVLGAVKQGSGPVTGPASFGVAPNSFRFTYAYDALQNMTARSAVGPKRLDVLTGPYRYGESGRGPRQLTSVATADGPVTLQYDAAGRVTEQAGRTHTYNGLDQLVKVAIPADANGPARTVTHAYGYDGLRTITEGDGATQYWLTPNLVERDGKREWYLRKDERTLVRIRLDPTRESEALAQAGPPLNGGSWAAAHQSVHAAIKVTATLLMGAVLLLGAWATVRARRGRRWVPANAGLLLAAMLGVSCGGGGSDEVAPKVLRWAMTEVLYFHGGIAAGPVLMTREDGTVFEERRYEPFGVPVDAFRETASGPQFAEIDHRAEPLNALNKETDPTSGYSYHGARWLSPHIAAWLTPDPPVKAPDAKFLEEPWALNPYQFVKQNPILYWDPDGNEEKPTGWQKAGAFLWGAAKGAAMGVATAAVIGAVAAVAAPAAVVIGVGMAAYGAYTLVNGGAEALAESGKRIINGEGTLEDFDTFGQIAGGLATGRMAKTAYTKANTTVKTAVTPKAPPPRPPPAKGVCTGAASVCDCSLAPAILVDTEHGPVAIERVALGERIGSESDVCEAMDFTEWVEVHFETEVINRGAVDHLTFRLLRPAEWMAATGMRAGERVHVVLEEFQLEAEVSVTHVGPAPYLTEGRRCPVIARIEHQSSSILSVELEGSSTPLLVTAAHPLFSVDANQWTPAADLVPGTQLETRSGETRVLSSSKHAVPGVVIDLQVADVSEFFVHEEQVRVHNCGKASPAAKGAAGGERAGKSFTRAGKAEVKAENAAANAGQTTCTNCGQSTVPAQQSRAGVTPPRNETHVDHIIPKSKGGNGSPDNGQVLCRGCNLEKGAN